MRRRARHQAAQSHEDPEMMATAVNLVQDREIAAASLRTFMRRLPPPQRSAVILKDVLGHSLEEICDVTGASVPSAKSALQRGRERLREFAREPEVVPEPTLADADRSRLARYVESFNARDFDSIRLMLADDVQLDLVNRLRAKGRD